MKSEAVALRHAAIVILAFFYSSRPAAAASHLKPRISLLEQIDTRGKCDLRVVAELFYMNSIKARPRPMGKNSLLALLTNGSKHFCGKN